MSESEIHYLKNRVKELEQHINELDKKNKSLIWKSYYYRFDEIYPFFNKNGIKKTANKFDMPIVDVMNFIIECDDNTFGVIGAEDYDECYLELYGKEYSA